MASLSEAPGQPKPGDHELSAGSVAAGPRYVVGMISLALLLVAALLFLVFGEVQ